MSSVPITSGATELKYALAPERTGVAVMSLPDAGEYATRLVIAPVGSWRRLPVGTQVAALLLGLAVLSAAALGVRRWMTSGLASASDLLIGAGIYGGVELIIVGVALAFLRRRILIDVADARLTIRSVTFGRVRLDGTWPLPSVGEVKRNANNGMLLVRITGKDMFELQLCRPAEVVEYVADRVNEAIAAWRAAGSPPSSTPMPALPTNDTGRVRGRASRAILWTALVAPPIGAVAVLFTPYYYLSAVILAPVMVVVGMLFGGDGKERSYFV